ncbi:hypothetical protein AB0C93_27400 [Streptomyces sp. NPDC048518]|uniref:hypothetical protein n=1 Tax=Streptomyces sp. NPDC048518 TaxID=3155029 RepID=UPI00340F798D
MSESWVIEEGNGDTSGPVSSAAAPAALRARIDAGRLETWLTSSSGRSLAFVTNTERAMVMLLEDADDPGEHAVDAGAQGTSGDFVLCHGQADEYANEDTVPIGEAFRLVQHILDTGHWPPDARWVGER